MFTKIRCYIHIRRFAAWLRVQQSIYNTCCDWVMVDKIEDTLDTLQWLKGRIWFSRRLAKKYLADFSDYEFVKD